MRSKNCLFQQIFVHRNTELLLLFSIISPWFYEIGLLKNLSTFAGKYLCCSVLLNKVAGWRPAALETLAQVLSCEFWKSLKKTFSTEPFRVTTYVCWNLSKFCVLKTPVKSNWHWLHFYPYVLLWRYSENCSKNNKKIFRNSFVPVS